MQFTPGRALTELKAQHAALRGMMERCLELADELDAGRCGPTQLLREAARLRLAFEAHNRFEEQLLRPVLLEADRFGEVRISQMEQQHIDEHRSLRTRLASHAGSPMTSELRQVIESLRTHLDQEERLLLSGKVLRDDIVTIEGSG